MNDILIFLTESFRSLRLVEREDSIINTIDLIFTFFKNECQRYEAGERDYELIQTMRIIANIAIDIKDKNVQIETYYYLLSTLIIADIENKNFDVLLQDVIKVKWNEVAEPLKVDKLFNPYPVSYARTVSLKNWVEYGLLRNRRTGYLSLGDEIDEATFFNNPLMLVNYHINTKKKVTFPVGAVLQGGKPCAWVFPVEELLMIHPTLSTSPVTNSPGGADDIVDRLGFPMTKYNDKNLWHNNHFISLFYPYKLPQAAYKASAIHAAWGLENMYASKGDNSEGWGQTVPIYQVVELGFKERVHLAFIPDDTKYDYYAYMIGSISKDFVYSQETLLTVTIENFYNCT